MHPRIVATLVATASMLAAAVPARAQSFSPSFGTTTYLDRIVESAASEQGAGEEAAGPGMLATTAAEPAEVLFPEKVPSIRYEFAYKNSSLPGDRQTRDHTVSPELHLKTAGEFALDLAAVYARTDAHDDASDSLDANTYAFLVTPSQELLTLAGKGRPATKLIAGMAIGYRHTDSDGTMFGLPFTADQDALALAPNVVLTQALSTRTLVSTGMIYAYETADTDVHGLGTTDDAAGVFSVLARGDFFMPDVFAADKVHAWVVAQWNHDVQVNSGVAKDDWAEFGGFMTWPLVENLGLRVGYSVAALRSDYIAHKASIRLEGACQ